MRKRSAVVIWNNDQIALIKRKRNGATYYVFPGGGIEENETPAEAAKREAMEELGLEVEIGECIYQSADTAEESYFLAQMTGGKFGTGTGMEFTEPDLERGTYEAVWIARNKLPTITLYPDKLAAKLSRSIE